MTGSPAVLRLEGIWKKFGRTSVLEGVDFSVQSGETVCLLGPNGSGKTTLLRCMNLLVPPDSGRICFKGDVVAESKGHRFEIRVPLHNYRAHFGMVFQHFELFPHLTAAQNVAVGPRHTLRMSRADARSRALEQLERVGLAKFAKSRPGQLSGGQKQRVAIARALAMHPDVILFDEPTSALDARTVDEVLELIQSLARTGTTMVVVTHELEFARDVADRVVVMENGQILEEGSSTAIFTNPTKARTRELLAKRASLRPDDPDTGTESLKQTTLRTPG